MDEQEKQENIEEWTKESSCHKLIQCGISELVTQAKCELPAFSRFVFIFMHLLT